MNNKFTKVLPLCVAAFLALPFVTEHAYAGEMKIEESGSKTEATVSDKDGVGVIQDYTTVDTNPWSEEQKEKVDYVKVANNTTTIGEYALAGMKGLKEVSLPKSVKEVKDYAFEGSDNLEKVTYEGTKKEYGKITIGHEGNEPLKNAKVEALSIGAEEIQLKTKDPVVGVDPEGHVTTSNVDAKESRFTIDEKWEETEGGKVKASSARWNGELESSEDNELFDKFKAGTEYKHTIRLTIPKALVDKGYKFDADSFTNAKIKVDGRNVALGTGVLSKNDTVATFTDLVTGIFAVPASEDTTGEGKDPKPAEAKKEEAKKAQAAKKEASNSEFYKTGDASVLPLISTMLTSGLAAFASRKKKD